MKKISLKEAKRIFLKGGDVYVKTENGFKKMKTSLNWEVAVFSMKLLTDKSRLRYFID